MRIRRDRRDGFSLVEALAVVSILGVLIALLIPAIQYARESARRAQCTNNLKQIGLSIASYASSTGVFPSCLGRYSAMARLLPYLDQLPVYNAINFESNAMSNTVRTCSVASFLCPSDTGGMSTPGMSNYAVNGGTKNSGDAPFSEVTPTLPWVGYQHVTDGISNTAFAAEWLTASSVNGRDPVRSTFETNSSMTSDAYPEFLLICRGIPYQTALLGGVLKGSSWAKPGYGLNLYNHALLPGEPTCLNGGLTLWGAWTVSSLHGVGINVAFGDGHVATVKQQVSNVLWSSIGTMNGGEVIDGL